MKVELALLAILGTIRGGSGGGATVDGFTELRPVLQVDNNGVVVRATETSDGNTYIALVTPKDAWTKELIITASTVFGYSLKCGDNYGEPMSGPNSEMKMNVVNFEETTGPFAIQFRKAKTFGIMTDYGTMTLPDSVSGHLIVFFWPNDSPGDHWNNFVNIINAGETVSNSVGGIASGVLQVGRAGTALQKMFGI